MRPCSTQEKESDHMWKWLVLGLAVYVLYRLFANDFLKKKKEMMIHPTARAAR